jgi:[ribosomal protein S5]-alanine N-acetyltransferase
LIGHITPPRLRGQHVRLRPFESGDLTDRYIGWLNDPIVNEYSRRRGVRTSREDAAQYMATLGAGEVVLAILVEPEGHVGNIKFGPIDWANSCADISIIIGEPKIWGHGIGTEAVYLTSKYLLRELGLNRVHADSCNPAFIRSVTKLGWKIEGVRRERVRLGQDFLDDTVVALLAREFKIIDEFEPALGEEERA